MAGNQFITLKDATALNALNDPGTVGLVDNIVNVAPEVDRIPGRIIPGTSYEATVLTAIGSNLAFRGANSGVPFSAPSLDEKRFNSFPLDCQFSIDEALLIKGKSNGETPAQIFAAHASAGVRQKALSLGRQIYLGSLNDPKGPPGLADFMFTQRTQVDSRTGLKINQAVDAGGTSPGNCQTIWFVKTGPQGVHWLFGNGTGVMMGPWVRLPGQASPDSTLANPRYQTAWKNNLFGYVGSSMAQVHAVGAIINVDVVNGTTTSNGLWNDNLVAQLWALFPIELKPDLAFCTQNAAFMLQKQRTVTNFVSGPDRMFTGAIAPIADFPTRLPTAGNIPLIITDSIVPANQYILN
jgi:hypothetical protein